MVYLQDTGCRPRTGRRHHSLLAGWNETKWLRTAGTAQSGAAARSPGSGSCKLFPCLALECCKGCLGVGDKALRAGQPIRDLSHRGLQLWHHAARSCGTCRKSCKIQSSPETRQPVPSKAFVCIWTASTPPVHPSSMVQLQQEGTQHDKSTTVCFRLGQWAMSNLHINHREACASQNDLSVRWAAAHSDMDVH